MEVVYKKSRSTVYPELLDTTSSRTTVYLRKNVEEVTEKDEMTGEETTMFVYDEAMISKADYPLYLATQESDQAFTDAQLALAELAEQVEANKTAMEEAMAELAEALMS